MELEQFKRDKKYREDWDRGDARNNLLDEISMNIEILSVVQASSS